MTSSSRGYASSDPALRHGGGQRPLKICIVDPFPNQSFTWERQFIRHLSSALERFGHAASMVRCSDEILQQDPDAVIVTNEAVAKLTHHYTIGFVWTYLGDDQTDVRMECAIRSWDLVVPSSLKARRFVRDLHFPNRRPLTLSEGDFYPTVMPTDLDVADPSRLSLVRVGRFSGLAQERRMLEEVAKLVGLNVYGPEKDWRFLAPGIYQGPLPTEPHAVMTLMNRHGAVLVPHGFARDADEIPSLHFFEACAAKCFVITTPIEALTEPFGDSLHHIDPGQKPDEMAVSVRDALEAASNAPETFRSRCAASAAVHRDRFSLEAMVAGLVERIGRTGPTGRIERNGALAGVRRQGREDGPSVSVIMRCGDRSLAMVHRAVASLQAQDYARIGLIIVTYADRPDLDASLDRLRGEARFLFVRHLRCPRTGVRSTTLWTGFEAVETDMFCNLDDDDELFPNHIGDMVSLLEEHPDVSFAYSGSVRQEEDGIYLNKTARFEGDLGIAVPERRDIDRFEDFDITKLLAPDCIIASNAWMARRSVLAPELLEDPDMEVMEDMFFFLFVASRHRIMFSGTVSAVYNFRSVAGDNTWEAVPRSIWDECMRRMMKRVGRLAFPMARCGMQASNSAQDVMPRVRDDDDPSSDEIYLDLGPPGLPGGVKRWTGISWPEPWGRWTDGAEAEIVFRRPLPPRFSLHLHARAYEGNKRSAISVGTGKSTERLLMPDDESRTYTLTIDNCDNRSKLRFTIPHPTKPSLVEGVPSLDTRRLGIAISWIEIRALAAE